MPMADRKLSICLVHEEYPEETGGAGIATYQATMAQALQGLGHSVVVVARTYKEERIERIDGIEVHRIKGYFRPKKIRGYLGYLFRVRHYVERLLKNRPIDVIECPEWRGEAWLLEKIPDHPPIFVRLHGGQKVIGYHSGMSFTVQRWLQCAIEKRSIAGADGVTSPSRTMIEETRRLAKLSLEKAVVVPNPVHPRAIDMPYQPMDFQNRTVLFVGRLTKIKGFPTLFQAVPRVVSQLPDVRFVFVGRYYGKIEIDPQYSKHIVLTGPVNYGEVMNYYQESALCVFPSLFEPFGLVVLEAMAAGRPVLLSDIGSFREIIAEGVHGEFFRAGDPASLADRIVAMFRDPDKMREMGVNGKKRVPDFGPETIAAQTVDAYLDGLGHK